MSFKTKEQRVFLKYDENNRLTVYLYSKNKTFLNTHLIKNGFANVDLYTSKLIDKFHNK